MENTATSEINAIEQMPGFTNISGFSSFIGYQETENSKTLQSKIKKATVLKKRSWWAVGFLPVLFFVVFYLVTGQLFYGLILSLAVLLLSLIFTRLVTSREKQAQEKYFNGRRNYGLRIANFVSSLFKAKYHYFPNGELFLYFSHFCSLIWIDNGNMVTYKKENIKNTELERVPLNKNESGWQLDIFSDLPEYPNISLKFENNEKDIAERLKATLNVRED